jgi:hypothetical protein
LYIVEFIQSDIRRSPRVVSRIRFPGDDLLRFAGEEQGNQPFECSDVVHDFARERQLPQKFYFSILAGLDWKKPQASLSAHSTRQAVPDGVGVIAEKLLTEECDYHMAQSEVPASKAVQADGLLSYSKISNHWTKRKLPADFQRVNPVRDDNVIIVIERYPSRAQRGAAGNPGICAIARVQYRHFMRARIQCDLADSLAHAIEKSCV